MRRKIVVVDDERAVREEVERRIREKIPFAFLRMDITNFKSFNDSHGIERGERVLRETAEILMESLALNGDGEGFMGHGGGADFVAMTSPAEAPYLAQRIVIRFDARAPGFYGRSAGRRGPRERRPAISLCIGVASTQDRVLDHYAKVARIASEMKDFCRSTMGHRLSRFAFDRRRETARVIRPRGRDTAANRRERRRAYDQFGAGFGG